MKNVSVAALHDEQVFGGKFFAAFHLLVDFGLQL